MASERRALPLLLPCWCCCQPRPSRWCAWAQQHRLATLQSNYMGITESACLRYGCALQESDRVGAIMTAWFPGQVGAHMMSSAAQLRGGWVSCSFSVATGGAAYTFSFFRSAGRQGQQLRACRVVQQSLPDLLPLLFLLPFCLRRAHKPLRTCCLGTRPPPAGYPSPSTTTTTPARWVTDLSSSCIIMGQGASS